MKYLTPIAFIALSLLTTHVSAETSCSADLKVDSFESSKDLPCNESSCTVVIELSVSVKACKNSSGSAELDIDIDAEDEREESISVSWRLDDDDDTDIETDVELDYGEWIGGVDIDSVECTCYDEI